MWSKRTGATETADAEGKRDRVRPLSKRGEETFERVMRIVASMYRERGYEGTSMIRLARRAGITAPAIYHYFGSKEDILASFLDYTLRDLIKSVRRGTTGGNYQEKARNFTVSLVRWQLEQAPFSEAYDRIFELGHLRNALPEKYRGHIRALERELYEIIAKIIDGGVRAGEFREVPVAPTAFAIIAMGDYVLGWYRPEGLLSQKQLAEFYGSLAVSMLSSVSGRGA